MSRKSILRKLSVMVIAFALVLTSITPAFAAAKAPALNAAEKTIVVGKSFNFDVKGVAKGATFTWGAYNPEIVSINKENGVVTGLRSGKTSIYCKVSASGKSYRLSAKVTVLKPAVKVTITNKVDTLNVKDYYVLKTKLTPASSNDIITWTSSDDSIVRVDSDGSFAALKAGNVTITATSLSGRSDSVTIKVLASGEVAKDTNASDDGKAEDSDAQNSDAKVLKTVLNEDFSASAGIFVARGSSKVGYTTAGKAAEGGKGYISVTGRSANWHGVAADITSLVTPGATYRVSAWVRYTSGADTENIKMTQERTSADDNRWVAIGSVAANKGEWTKIEGTMEVSPTTTQVTFYLEADTLIDFYVDNVVIDQLDVALAKKDDVKVEKAKVGTVVYSNDFEDGSVVNARVNAERKNTTAVAHNGKASVQVTRTAGWDGAGIVFNADNKISKASLLGTTVHTKVYVMYKDGPDEVTFKMNNHMEKADDSENIVLQTPVKKGVWTLLEADCTIADGATGNMIFIETDNDGALTFYMDDMEIKVVK